MDRRQLLSRGLDKFAKAGQMLDLARLTSTPVTRIIDRQWRQAVQTARWQLIPAAVRRSISVAVDVGANKGDWTSAILHLSTPKRVIAFEPIPRVSQVLRDRFRNDHRVTVIPKAVGAEQGRQLLNIEKQSELSSLRLLTGPGRRTHGAPNAPADRVEVEVTTLDDALADQEEITLLKIDVQGGEREVIRGGLRTLQKCKCLVIEVLYQRDYYDGAAGFLELTKLLEESTPLRLSCASEPALNAAGLGAWADAVFVHEEFIKEIMG